MMDFILLKEIMKCVEKVYKPIPPPPKATLANTDTTPQNATLAKTDCGVGAARTCGHWKVNGMSTAAPS